MTMKTMAAISILSILCACSTGLEMTATVDPLPSVDFGQLEQRTTVTSPEGGDLLIIKPNINSRDELMQYRELKKAQALQILQKTWGASGERPYYPAIITMARPITIAELNDLISSYNPSVKSSLTKSGRSSIARLEKAEFVAGVDKLVINNIRFNSTTGKGQLSYETMSDERQLADLEQGLAAKESELNGIEQYQLVEGITSVFGGVHRENVISLFDDPRIFLADIGPAEIYDGKIADARWDDVSALVSKYLSN
ncbi:MAG: hypothetical protein WC956_03565 [bacterium]